MNPTPESAFSSGCIRFLKKQSQITKIKKSQFSKRFSTKTLLHSEFGLSPVGEIIKNQASFQEEHSPKKLLIIMLQEIKCPTSAIETPFRHSPKDCWSPGFQSPYGRSPLTCTLPRSGDEAVSTGVPTPREFYPTIPRLTHSAHPMWYPGIKWFHYNLS